MEKAENEEKCFTITWKIENANYCSAKCDQRLKSPSFMVDEMEGIKWQLHFYPRGKEADTSVIGICLHRMIDKSSVVPVKVKFDIALMKEDGCELMCHPYEYDFEKGSSYGNHSFAKLKDIHDTSRHMFLPEDTLTIRCRIWKTGDESIIQDVRCLARTIIMVEKRSFLWNLENFSNLELEKKCRYQIKSHKNEKPMMSLYMFVTARVNCDEIIRFELSLKDEAIKYSTYRLFLVDASGNKVECNQEEFWFDEYLYEGLTFSLTKKKLLANEKVYLPNDILSLQWQWAFVKGIAFGEIEEIQYGCTDVGGLENKISDDREMKESPTNPLLDTLKYFQGENLLCDVKLKTRTGTFPAHKIILSAFSPVFKTMFSSDRKETDRDCVDIEDMSDDTIKQMLHYIYTSSPGDLTGESATRLYDAANKYALVGLKNTCASYLKDNLSSSNALDILLLADKSTDGDLKAAVFDYVEKNGKEIEESAWKMLMDANGKLAADVLYNLFSKD